jgi:hypothetical protein
MRLARVLALVLGFLLLGSTPASGDEAKVCGEHGHPWIRLRTERLSPELRALLMTHVRSSLAARHIDLCVSDEPTVAAPLATLDVVVADAGVATGIVVNDGVTRKRVSRDLDLRGVPSDGQAFTIALALDELLRASWAELMLPDAQADKPVPKVVTEALPRVAPPSSSAPRAKTWELGAAFGGEHFSEGHDQVGADLAVSYALWSRLALDARLGLRAGFPVQAPRGEIRSTALGGSLGLSFSLVPRTGRAGLDLLGEAWLHRVTFIAEPSGTGIRGTEKTAIASYLVTGIRGWYLVLPSLRAFVRVGGGAPLHTAYATDGDVRVTGLAGLLLLGDAGLSVVF